MHLTEARIAFRKQSIVQTPSGLQVSTQAALLAPIHAQGQFDEKGWGLRSLHGLLCLSRDVLTIPELNTKESALASVLLRSRRFVLMIPEHVFPVKLWEDAFPPPLRPKGTAVHPRHAMAGAFPLGFL